MGAMRGFLRRATLYAFSGFLCLENIYPALRTSTELPGLRVIVLVACHMPQIPEHAYNIQSNQSRDSRFASSI